MSKLEFYYHILLKVLKLKGINPQYKQRIEI
jgi:hypothetical protein